MKREDIIKKAQCPCFLCEEKSYKVDEKLIDLVIELDKKFKIRITSGARCEDYNRSIGGYYKSPHIPDYNNMTHALDIQTDLTPMELALECEGKISRIGIYQSHVHIDTIKPFPSKFWYVNKETIYSGQIKTLKEFLEKLKKEGRLSYDDRNTFDRISSNSGSMVFIPKKEYKGL
jgi:hypothetical protein